MKNQVLILAFLAFFCLASASKTSVYQDVNITPSELAGSWSIIEAGDGNNSFYKKSNPGKYKAYRHIRHEFTENYRYTYTNVKRKKETGTWEWHADKQQLQVKLPGKTITFTVKSFGNDQMVLEKVYQGRIWSSTFEKI